MPDLMAEWLKALEKARDDFIKARVDEEDSKQVANLKWRSLSDRGSRRVEITRLV